MNPIRRPRPWVLLASFVALGFALWLLLVPTIALYYVNEDGEPYGVESKYAWGRGTSDQTMILPADMFGEEDPVAGDGGEDGLLTSVRLNCGFVFTSGEGEADAPAGDAACSAVETPRLLGGLGLIVVGIGGFVVAQRLRARDYEEEGRP